MHLEIQRFRRRRWMTPEVSGRFATSRCRTPNDVHLSDIAGLVSVRPVKWGLPWGMIRVAGFRPIARPLRPIGRPRHKTLTLSLYPAVACARTPSGSATPPAVSNRWRRTPFLPSLLRPVGTSIHRCDTLFNASRNRSKSPLHRSSAELTSDIATASLNLRCTPRPRQGTSARTPCSRSIGKTSVVKRGAKVLPIRIRIMSSSICVLLR